jgi:hypothetical protein
MNGTPTEMSATASRGFTYTLFDAPERSWGFDAKRHAQLRAKVEKGLLYLGPWCSRCGKKGPNCRDRNKCVLRTILAKPCKPSVLPCPPMEWCEARGYAKTREKYTMRPELLPWVNRRDIAQQYAYEVAMGRDTIAEEEPNEDPEWLVPINGTLVPVYLDAQPVPCHA